MLRLPLTLALLLVASASATIYFPRNGCGCLRNPVAAELKEPEINRLRGYVQSRGVKHYKSLTDQSLQAIFRFNLLNSFPDVVPSSRSGVLQLISESLNDVSDKVVLSQSLIVKIVKYLQGNVPELATGKINIDLYSLVSAASVILYQRGVSLGPGQINAVLKSGLSGYLQSTAYRSSYGKLAQLLASLDHIDHNLPNILDQDILIDVRRKLETRFNLDNKIFDARFQAALRVFEVNRARILDSFNSLAYRGPRYEVNVQIVIKEIIRIFPGIRRVTIRSVLNILQLTNSGKGKATPKDLLAMITLPRLDISLRSISVEIANRIYLKLPYHHKGLTRKQIQEAYILYIIGLASQGIQPLQLRPTYEAFVRHTQRFFLGTRVYTIEAYFLYVIRVVVPSIPRGSPAFRLYIFDSSVVVEDVLVPEPLKSIYKEGRQTIIERIRGLQGNSIDITKRLIRGEGEKAIVENIVDLRPEIKAGNLPTYDQFEYEGVILSALQLQSVAVELQQRFNRLKQPKLTLPLLRVLIRANVIRGTGDQAAAAFRRLFQGLPEFKAPQDVSSIITQLSERRLQLTEVQLRAALQQFYVAVRCLGYEIPQQSIPGVFVYTVRQYLSTLTYVPKELFDYRFLEYLYQRLATIIQQVVLVNKQVPVAGRQVQNIFKIFGRIRISIRAQTTIIRFIDNSGLIKKPAHGSYATVEIYRRLLASLLTRYPVKTFILRKSQLTILRSQLIKVGIKISLQDCRDANILSFIGLGLFNRLKPTLTYVEYRQLLFVSIQTFVRINKVSNIASSNYIRVLYRLQKVKVPSLPVPRPPVIQTPVYVPPPIYIVRGITLSVKKVQELVAVLRVRFSFVSLDNVQPILAHTIYLLRRTKKISADVTDSKIIISALIEFYNGLPNDLSIDGIDLDALLKDIDEKLVDATISGTGIRSGLVELYLHMYSLSLPIPSVQIRIEFFSFIIGAYGQTKVRRQLPFGENFYQFLSTFLPNLGGYVKPFPIFSGPKLYKLFASHLKVQVVPADFPLLLHVCKRTSKLGGTLTIDSLTNVISGHKSTSGSAPLSSGELSQLLDDLKKDSVKVSQGQIRRAFLILRLTIRLSSVDISRGKVLKIFKRVVKSTLQRGGKLLVLSYVEQIIVQIRTSITVIRPPVVKLPTRPIKKPLDPFRKGHGGLFD